MNNATIKLVTGVSKKGKEYAYLTINVNGVLLEPIFIKTTEIPYYSDLLK